MGGSAVLRCAALRACARNPSRSCQIPRAPSKSRAKSAALPSKSCDESLSIRSKSIALLAFQIRRSPPSPPFHRLPVTGGDGGGEAQHSTGPFISMVENRDGPRQSTAAAAHLPGRSNSNGRFKFSMVFPTICKSSPAAPTPIHVEVAAATALPTICKSMAFFYLVEAYLFSFTKQYMFSLSFQKMITPLCHTFLYALLLVLLLAIC
ncbi:hypothetical protein SETIT_7G274100v2 [Setaria italica]|uniref:Uncharacterized protein n=1 Tax=Setaria italica TaxID=4555 RepID=A0A368S076_SETIT|nr:hypothetical protein SETIT_7G274100v2 [Setaria italica]